MRLLSGKARSLARRAYSAANISFLMRLVDEAEANRGRVERLPLSCMREEFRKAVCNGSLSKGALPYVLCMAGAVVREKIGLCPRREQYLCALGLYFGFMCEMKAGEGKSLAAALAGVLCAARGKVHIVTVNDYLARRDGELFKDVYGAFGLECGHNARGMHGKRELYRKDVVYTSSHELVFDYLRGELTGERPVCALDTAIIDEVDFVLLDNATSRLSVSINAPYVPPLGDYVLAREVCSVLKGTEARGVFGGSGCLERIRYEAEAHYVYCPGERAVYLTMAGIEFLSALLGKKNILFDSPGFCRAVLDTLRAKHFFLRGRDYLVEDGRVVLVNRYNGRAMPDSYLEPGLHTAIECKEGAKVTPKPFMALSLSYQTFFSKYRWVAGMSGTAADAAEEFEELFGRGTLIIPRYSGYRVKDHGDLVFMAREQKYAYLVDLLRKKNPDQPVLVLAGSDEEAAHVAELLEAAGFKGHLLVNGTLAEEDRLVEEAGRHGTITVSTVICGRGTDILLDERARAAGGLFVVCLEHHASRRVDEQVKGRTGRQGDPGEVLFLVSFDDEIWHYADSSEVVRLKDEWCSRGQSSELYRRRVGVVVAGAQERCQDFLASWRKQMFELDYVVEAQRQKVFRWAEELIGSGFDGFLREAGKLLHRRGGQHIDAVLVRAAEKVREIGEEMLRSVFEKIVRGAVQYHWLVLSKELDDLRAGLQWCRLGGLDPVLEFTRICAEKVNALRADACRDAALLIAGIGVEQDRMRKGMEAGYSEAAAGSR